MNWIRRKWAKSSRWAPPCSTSIASGCNPWPPTSDLNFDWIELNLIELNFNFKKNRIHSFTVSNTPAALINQLWNEVNAIVFFCWFKVNSIELNWFRFGGEKWPVVGGELRVASNWWPVLLAAKDLVLRTQFHVYLLVFTYFLFHSLIYEGSSER